MFIEVALENIADIQLGYQARSKIQENLKGTYRLIQGKDFNEYNQLVVESLIHFFPERKSNNYLIKKGDILFQARGTNHYAYCVREILQNVLAAGSFYIICVRSEKILPEYLCWWLNQSPAQNYFQSRASATIISYISINAIALLKIPVPPLSIQEKVVGLIDLMNKEQAQTDRLVKLRRQLIQSICKKVIKEKGE